MGGLVDGWIGGLIGWWGRGVWWEVRWCGGEVVWWWNVVWCGGWWVVVEVGGEACGGSGGFPQLFGKFDRASAGPQQELSGEWPLRWRRCSSLRFKRCPDGRCRFGFESSMSWL